MKKFSTRIPKVTREPKLFFKYVFIYLAVLGLSCSKGDVVPWKEEVVVIVAQLCLTLCDSMNCSPSNPGPQDWEHKSPGHWTTREVPKIFLKTQVTSSMKYLCYILDKVSSSTGDTGECPLAHNLYPFPQTKVKFTITVFCPNSSDRCPQSRVRHVTSLPYSLLQTLCYLFPSLNITLYPQESLEPGVVTSYSAEVQFRVSRSVESCLNVLVLWSWTVVNSWFTECLHMSGIALSAFSVAYITLSVTLVRHILLKSFTDDDYSHKGGC